MSNIPCEMMKDDLRHCDGTAEFITPEGVKCCADCKRNYEEGEAWWDVIVVCKPLNTEVPNAK